MDHTDEVVTFASKPPIGQDPIRRSAAATKLNPKAICVLLYKNGKILMRH